MQKSIKISQIVWVHLIVAADLRVANLQKEIYKLNRICKRLATLAIILIAPDYIGFIIIINLRHKNSTALCNYGGSITGAFIKAFKII